MFEVNVKNVMKEKKDEKKEDQLGFGVLMTNMYQWDSYRKIHWQFNYPCAVLKGGGVWWKPKLFFQNFCCFLETTNLASPYLKTCFTVKIWLNFMHRNLISMLIHTPVPVPGGGEGYVIGWTKCLPKCSQYDFRLIWRPKNSVICFAVPSGVGGPELGTQSQVFMLFSDSSPQCQVRSFSQQWQCQVLYASHQ